MARRTKKRRSLSPSTPPRSATPSGDTGPRPPATAPVVPATAAQPVERRGRHSNSLANLALGRGDTSAFVRRRSARARASSPSPSASPPARLDGDDGAPRAVDRHVTEADDFVESGGYGGGWDGGENLFLNEGQPAPSSTPEPVTPPPIPPDEDDHDVGLGERYLGLVGCDRDAHFARLTEASWILPGFDSSRLRLQTPFVHLTLDPTFNLYYCSCKADSPCAHELAHRADAETFALVAPRYPHAFDLPSVEYIASGSSPRLLFSVQQSQGFADSGKRCAVMLEAKGGWKCAASGCRQECVHVRNAQKVAVELGRWQAGPAAGDGEPANAGIVVDVQESSREVAVSHKPRTAPVAYRMDIPHDRDLPVHRSGPPNDLPPQFPLEPDGRCRCGLLAAEAGLSTSDMGWSDFIVHTEHGAVKRRIQTAPCPRCKHARRRIGPDLAEYGLVNWNNGIGFARELFDGFLVDFSNKETTFSSFVKGVEARYLLHGSEYGFPQGGKTFERACYAFLRLVRLDSPMACRLCGSRPDVVICDGTSIGFASRMLGQALSPPTFPTTESKIKAGVHLGVDLSPLAGPALGLPPSSARALRNGVRAWAKETAVHACPMSADTSSLLEKVKASGTGHGLAFSQLLDEFGTLPDSNPERAVYAQALYQFASPDPVFTMLPVQALSLLEHWLQGGPLPKSVRVNVPLVSLITAFPLRPGTASFLAHLIVFARARYLDLVYRTSQTSELDDEAALATAVRDMTASTDPWRSGSCYGLSRVRSRPIYSSIKNDAGRRRLEAQSVVDDGGKTGECGKRFTSYGKNGLIGGVAGIWCTHGECLGYHLMPTSEGRDDFFSALLCHWESAPKIVVYDFACSLAAYCMVREPEFFANTRFLIDELHAHGHTACSPACFISTAMQADPPLRKINSSAAHIAHSLSFMNEEHAALVLWAVIQIHNRQKLIQTGQRALRTE